jgi:hypothetical protein
MVENRLEQAVILFCLITILNYIINKTVSEKKKWLAKITIVVTSEKGRQQCRLQKPTLETMIDSDKCSAALFLWLQRFLFKQAEHKPVNLTGPARVLTR